MFDRLRNKNAREEGSLTIFALITFITMITLAGFAIDTARVELERTKIQLAVDNAALAAASLNQSLDPETGKVKSPGEVVDLYMAKADVSEAFRSSYRVVDQSFTEGNTQRTVEVTGSDSISTYFMELMGVDLSLIHI